MSVSEEHKKDIKKALHELEKRYDPGKFDNWKWKNNYQRLELYNWEFATEHKNDIARWLESHGYTCACQFRALGIDRDTIYLNKPLSEQLRTLFSLTWA